MIRRYLLCWSFICYYFNSIYRVCPFSFFHRYYLSILTSLWRQCLSLSRSSLEGKVDDKRINVALRDNCFFPSKVPPACLLFYDKKTPPTRFWAAPEFLNFRKNSLKTKHLHFPRIIYTKRKVGGPWKTILIRRAIIKKLVVIVIWWKIRSTHIYRTHKNKRSGVSLMLLVCQCGTSLC